MDSIKNFKISKLAIASGIFTSSIVYVSITNTGEFSAYLADNSIKIVGKIGSGFIKIIWGNNSYIKSLSSVNKLADYIKNNIKDGSELFASGTSTMAGFVAILTTVTLEFTYTNTKNYFIKDNQIELLEINDSDIEISNIDDDYEIITFKKDT